MRAVIPPVAAIVTKSLVGGKIDSDESRQVGEQNPCFGGLTVVNFQHRHVLELRA